MSEEIVVPVLGESITEATVSKWLKKSGENVKADEPIVELETDKVNLEVPSPVNGVLTNIKTKEGETVKVGALLGVVSEGEKTETTKIEKIKPEAKSEKTSEEKSNVLNFEKTKPSQPKIFEEKNLLNKNFSQKYSELLSLLTKKVLENNAKPIYITQNSGYGISQELYSAAETVMKHCADFNLSCINLAKDLDLNYEDFYDELHLNPKGSKKVSDFLTKRLKKIIN